MSKSTFRERIYEIFVQLILIITGILTALAVENYRQSLQEQQAEKGYLISLRNAVQADTAALKREIQRTYVKIKGINELIELSRSSSSAEEEKFGETITDVLMLIRLNLVTSVYEELKFTGNFKLIQNNELKLDIISYYNDITIIQQENERNVKYPTELIKLISLEELEYKIPFDQKRILEAIANRNTSVIRDELLYSQKSAHFVRTTMIYTLMPRCMILLEKLQAEIDRNQ